MPGSGGRDLKTYVFVLPNSSIREKSASFVSNKVIKAHMTAVRQFSSVAQLCPTLCDPLDCSTPGLPVYHQLPKFTQTHVHRIGDAIQPSHPLSSPSPPAFSLSQHQGFSPVSQFFASDGQSFRISASTSVFPMNIQDWFPLGWTGWISLQFKGLLRVFCA